MRVAAAVMSLLVRPSASCTTVVVNATKEDAVAIGRTMELGIPLSIKETNTLWALVTTPRGATLGKGISLPYGFVSISGAVDNVTSLETVVEGMNEKGLTVSVQTLRRAGYEEAAGDRPALTFTSVAAYLLGACASTSDVAGALAKVRVVDGALVAALMGRAHWAVSDARGSSVVVEYVAGALDIHENSRVGVLTNDPAYDWHLDNLDQYAGYATDARQAPWGLEAIPVGAGREVPAVSSHGVNTRALPASYTPPDRFVKMFLLRETAVAHDPPETADDALTLVAGLLNTVHIVRGAVPKLSHAEGFEFTNWAVVKLPKQRTFLLRTYSDMQWRRVDLAGLDFARASYPEIPLYDGLGVRDITWQ